MSTSRTTSTAHTVESEGALANGKSLFLVAVPQHILNLKEDQAATLKKTQDFYRELIENNRGKMTPAEREHWDKGRKANTIFIPRPDEVSQECRLEYWERCTELSRELHPEDSFKACELCQDLVDLMEETSKAYCLSLFEGIETNKETRAEIMNDELRKWKTRKTDEARRPQSRETCEPGGQTGKEETLFCTPPP